MEIRRASQLLFRSQSVFSTSSLTTTSPRTATSFAKRASLSFTCHSCRQFSIQPRLWRDDYNPNAPIKGIQNISISAEKESGSSLDDMEKPFSWPSRDQQYPDSYKPPIRNYKEYNSDRLLFPDNGLGSSDVDATLPKQRVLTELPIHLTPRTGRSIDVDPGKNNDLGTRMRQLDMLCARNQIRSDFSKQRFHERGGMKRKRLKSQRWRIRFKNEFRKTVLRVQQLRKKGW